MIIKEDSMLKSFKQQKIEGYFTLTQHISEKTGIEKNAWFQDNFGDVKAQNRILFLKKQFTVRSKLNYYYLIGEFVLSQFAENCKLHCRGMKTSGKDKDSESKEPVNDESRKKAGILFLFCFSETQVNLKTRKKEKIVSLN